MINKKGLKGIVYDSSIFIKELENINFIVIYSIDDKGYIKKNIVNVNKIINDIDNKILVKKFIVDDMNETTFYNELNGYKKIIKMFGNNVKKYTTVTE